VVTHAARVQYVPVMSSADERAVPWDEYRRRLAARRERCDRLDRRDRLIAYLRGATFVATAVAAWLSLGRALLPVGLPVAGVLTFLVLVVVHAGVIEARDRARRAAAYYRRGLARVDERPEPPVAGDDAGQRFADPAHPYARDLDLFGRDALFPLISTARTRPGEERLAAWLLAPAAVDEARARQAAVTELAGRLDLREQLALDGDDVRAEVDSAALVAWATRPLAVTPPWVAVVLGLVSTSALGAVIAWQGFGYDPRPAVAALVVLALAHWLMRGRVRAATEAVDRAERGLGLIGHLIARFEREPCESPRLRALRHALAETRAAAAVAALSRWVSRLAWQGNQFFAPLGFLLLWRPQVACAIERWRRRHGTHVAQWLDTLADFEALVSLSAYAYERPEEPMPELDHGGAPTFVAEALGHPLIPRARCTRNDFALGGDEAPHLYVVSGSNMSGKSTLLRAIGLNAVLAFAGAPVRARRLKLTLLMVGTSMRLEDSITDGVSRFYAEVKRLRMLVELAARASPPLLFLIDEILSGTNSHDRRIGAEALVRALLARGAVGLVTTHDLALAELGRTLERAANVHFEDVLDGARTDGQLSFDYRIRPGPIDVGRSNALALMRGAGLPV
jgi:hypothetical protein